MNTLLPLSEVSLNAEVPACPLCSCGQVRKISEYTGKSLWRCLSCDVAFLFPQPPLQEYAAHFGESAALTTDELRCKFENNRTRVLERVATEIRRLRPKSSVLDIGCATGIFLDEHFSGWDRWGVDLSPIAAERATRAGIQVHCGTVRGANFTDKRFDVITILDAFYYFRSPQNELTEILRILKDDGLLALELPLASSRIWRNSSPIGQLLSGSKQPLLRSSDHLFYFSPKSVVALLRRCGFTVDSVLPLPGNRQRTLLRDIGMRSYYQLSLALKTISRSRVFLAPRFLVLARKAIA